MESCTIYYADTNNESTVLARKLASAMPDTSLAAATIKTEHLIYENNKTIGFVFPSRKGHPPDEMLRIARRIIADKGSYFFVIIPCGERQLTAAYAIEQALSQKGMTLCNAYVENILKKTSMTPDELIIKMAAEITAGEKVLENIKHQVEAIPKKELRKLLKKRILDYKKEKKRNS